jgi:hypothetical protein
MYPVVCGSEPAKPLLNQFLLYRKATDFISFSLIFLICLFDSNRRLRPRPDHGHPKHGRNSVTGCHALQKRVAQTNNHAITRTLKIFNSNLKDSFLNIFGLKEPLFWCDA